MAIGNLGAVKNIIDGYTAMDAAAGGGFTTLANFNQGTAMFADAVRDVLARADLSSALNAKAKMFTGSATVSIAIETGAANLIGIVADSTNGTDLFLQVYNTAQAGVTVGTTAEVLDLVVRANAQNVYVFEQPIAFGTALTFAISTAAHGAVLTGGANVKVLFVYTL
jgi:hypothetical protein